MRKARRLMVEHGFTGKEAADQVKHAGDPGNLNRWFRNHKPAVEIAARAKANTPNEIEQKETACQELKLIGAGRLEAATRSGAPAPVISKPQYKKKKKGATGKATKGFRMKTNQLAGLQIVKSQLATIKDQALGRSLTPTASRSARSPSSTRSASSTWTRQRLRGLRVSATAIIPATTC